MYVHVCVEKKRGGGILCMDSSDSSMVSKGPGFSVSPFITTFSEENLTAGREVKKTREE